MGFRPTNELRYVLCYSHFHILSQVLQQKWIDDDPNDESKCYIEEWRDVPVVEKEASAISYGLRRKE